LNREQKKYVQIFQNTGQNLLDLINDILNISKIEAGQIELRKSDFNLRETIDNACEILALNAHEKGKETIQTALSEKINTIPESEPKSSKPIKKALLRKMLEFFTSGE